jgi:aspartokinase
MGMRKFRLGGIKILEGRSHLTSSRPAGEQVLPAICSHLAAHQINLPLVTHLVFDQDGGSITSLCTESADTFSSYFLLKLSYGQGSVVKLESAINILSIFPHDQRPAVTGTLLALLLKENTRPHGFASSPSALSVLVSGADTRKVIDGLFDVFEFPAFQSPAEWYTAYERRERLLREVECSYQEKVIKVYNIAHQPNLELWRLSLPWSRLADFGTALTAMDRMGIRMPFLIAQHGQEENLSCGLAFADTHREQARQILALYLPELDLRRRHPVTAFFITGPHFGDRHGITNTMVQTLQNASVSPLAMGCTVSSISLIVRVEDEETSRQVLAASFQVPSDQG